MKNFKRFLAMMITCVMAITLCAATGITAVAEEDTITIKINPGDSADHNYVAYPIFTGNVTTDEVTGEKTIANAEWSGAVASAFVGNDWQNFLKDITVDSTPIFGENDVTSAAKVAEKMRDWGDNSPEARAFAKAFADKALNDGGFRSNSITFSGSNGTYTTTNSAITGDSITVVPGYYLIVDNANLTNADGRITEYILALVDENGLEINAKPTVPTLEKKIITDTGKVDANSASVGDTITYQITGNIIDASRYNKFFYIIEDTLSSGLTFDEIKSVMVYPEEGEGMSLPEESNASLNLSYYHALEKLDGDNTKLKIGITNYKELNDDDYTGGKIVIEYTATLNKDAVIGGTGNPNTVHLEYSNNPNHEYKSSHDIDNTYIHWEPASGQPMGKTAASKVVTYTTGIQINKVDGGGNALDGATFSISGAGIGNEVIVNGVLNEELDNTVSAEVDENGILTFTGLGAGTYTIKETKAPDGYNKLSDPITVTIADAESEADGWNWTVTEIVNGEETPLSKNDKDLYELKVVNNKGGTLPSTGGTGTTIFYVVGSFLLFGAARLFISKKRKDEKSE